MYVPSLALFLSLIWLIPGQVQAQSNDPLGTRNNPVAVDIPDSLVDDSPASTPGSTGAPSFRVRGARVRAAASPSAWALSGGRVEATDTGDLESVVRLLPAARPTMNSRGETVFSVRGAPERHVQVTLDGIPLTVPWDERVDLSMIPTDALGGVSIDRGVTTALAIPGGLAGIVELNTRDLTEAGHRTRLGGQIGEVEAWSVRGLHAHRTDNWSFLVAGSHRTRDAFLLPLGRTLPMNQASLQTRTNSDLKQSAWLARVARRFETGKVAVIAHLASGERGVPPESHLGSPRLWRIPDVNRTLVGVSGELRPTDRWTLHGVLAVDQFHQEIREFDDTTYSTPDLTSGIDYETGDDQTVTARLRGSMESEMGRWSVQGHLRSTQHEESTELDGPVSTYSQRILALAAEWSRSMGADWQIRAGGGVEAASTPDSGPQPAQDDQSAPVISGGVTRLFDWGQIEARASRKSRFPSLRELYSGALGRFMPNPDLEPEDQNLVELAALRRWEKVELTAGVFGARTDGLIQREVVDTQTGEFMRVNLDDVRSLGLELGASVQPATGVRLLVNHALLHVRSDEGDGFTARVEDRPDYITQAIASLDHSSGVRLQLEGILTGQRVSADASADSGIASLDAQAQLNVRIAYRYFSSLAHLSHIEWFGRVDNVLDADLDAQFGLPEAGRMITTGLRVLLD